MVLEKIKNILGNQFNVDEDSINEDTSFRDDLDADSLDLVELIMELEDEFDLEIEDEEVNSIETVEDALNYIEKRSN
ncbi:MAG TPA: acyl carrier protein [Tissierellaceae bacterium]|nr:acyl carrier protein [Tissierellaceae bacterium]